MLTRTAAAGQAPPLDLDGMPEAAAELRAFAAQPGGARTLLLADAVVASHSSLADAAGAMKELGLQELAVSAERLAASEASFRDQHWLPRQARLEQFGEKLVDWYGESWPRAVAAMNAGLRPGAELEQFPVALVTTMPAPGGVTLHLREGMLSVVSLADLEGDLRPMQTLAEVVLHECLHQVDARARVAEGESMSERVGALGVPRLAHAYLFALGDRVMREVFGLEGPSYAEREGIYARMGQTAELLARRMPQLGAEELLAELSAFAARKKRPNLLLILADDQGWADFSYLGMKDDVSTPNLDQLAAEGVSMTQAYASSPICNPSRVGLITGRYQQRWNNFYYGGGQGLPAEAITLAERLKAAGYATGYFGKVHTGGPDNGPDKPGFPLNQGFDRFFGTTCGGRVHYLYHSREAQRRYGKAAGQMEVEPMWDDREQIEWEGFTTVDWTTKTIEFIRQHPDRPWFAFLNHNAVHNFAWQLPDDELEARGLERFPDWNADEIEYREWYKGVHRRDWPEGRAYYLAQLEVLDREVGRLLDAVEQYSDPANTIVVYTVDNGGCVPDWADNGPLAGSKYHLMEGGTRVRTFVRMPDVIPAGRVHEGVFSCLDLAPTICEMIGLPTEAGAFDGLSQLAQLQGKKPADATRTLHWDTGWQWSVRMGDWKLLVTTNENRARSSANFEQVDVRFGTHLYHLGEDPGETTNLAEDRPDLVELLSARHASWRASIGKGTD